MDIRPQSHRPDPRRSSQERLREHADGLAKSQAAGRAAAARLQEARQESAARARAMSAGDQLDLSPASRLLGAEGTEDTQRQELIQRLRDAYESGSLNNAHRIRKAAERLLGS